MASPLAEIALLFLRLGTTAFGGPAAHIALMEEEVVRRRAWLSREELLDLIGAANLIPGPNSTELAIHIGHRRAGWLGLVVAGACFILPAAAITLACAWLYARYGAKPQVDALFYGAKPVIVAVVLQALVGLGRAALKSVPLGIIAAACAIGSALGAPELALLLGAGAIAAAARPRKPAEKEEKASALALPLLKAVAAPVAAAPFGLAPLFLIFLKIGSVLFGSGYVLLAFLRADLVERHHWLTEAQLLDAVAIGQITPGPVFTTATFLGYLLGGVPGAALATLGIFLPAFVFVAISGPLVPRLRRSPIAGAFLDGVNAASLALMAVVTAQLGRAAIVDLPTAALGVAGAIALLRYRVGSVWVMAAGAVIGAAVRALV
jgi:chromate transporter